MRLEKGQAHTWFRQKVTSMTLLDSSPIFSDTEGCASHSYGSERLRCSFSVEERLGSQESTSSLPLKVMRVDQAFVVSDLICARTMYAPCSDVDIEEYPGALLLVTIGVEHGTITLSPALGVRPASGAVTFWAGDYASFDGSASFFSRLTSVNDALVGMTYRPARDWNGNDTLSVVVDDRGWTGQVTGGYVAHRPGLVPRERSARVAVRPKPQLEGGCCSAHVHAGGVEESSHAFGTPLRVADLLAL